MCVCVSEPLIKEMKDILMTWRAACRGLSLLMLLFLWVRACVRAYEEYLHSSASRLTNGQTLVRHEPPLSLPSLRIIRHTCDCRGISNVGVLLTLTYITCAVFVCGGGGGHSSCVRQDQWIHKD